MLFSVIQAGSTTLAYLSDSVLLFLQGASFEHLVNPFPVTFIDYHTARFGPSNFVSSPALPFYFGAGSFPFYYGFCWLLTAIVSRASEILLHTSVRPPVVRHEPSSHATATFTLRFPGSIRTSFCLANSSNRICLMLFVCLGSGLCRRLPSDSPRGGHPCLKLMVGYYRPP